MQITDVTVQVFAYRSKTVRDSEGHGHPGPENDASQSLVTIQTDEGVQRSRLRHHCPAARWRRWSSPSSSARTRSTENVCGRR